MAIPQQQVIDKCKEIYAKAQALYQVDLSKVGIRFDLKGRAAGQACRRGGMYYMRYNMDVLQRELADTLNDTVPHEIAHIVCYMKPALGANHNYGWERVCRALGGSGASTHDLEVVHGKGHTYEYITDRGHAVRLGDKHHAHVQSGREVRFKQGKGVVTKQCKFTVVGYQGRTYATPKVPTAPAPAPVQMLKPLVPVSIPKPVFVPVVDIDKAVFDIIVEGKQDKLTYDEIIDEIIAITRAERSVAHMLFLKQLKIVNALPKK